MKEAGYTVPQLRRWRRCFELLRPGVQKAGYNARSLPAVDHGAVDAGLKYVNNDICYRRSDAGQIVTVTSGRYDTDHLAVLITQTGGGCRATNYISLIRKALKAAGLGISSDRIRAAAGAAMKNHPGSPDRAHAMRRLHIVRWATC